MTATPGTSRIGDPPAALHVEALTVSYQDVRALDNVTVRILPSRICGLVGVNGSGKSTLFKSLMGLLQPDSGSVRLFGCDNLTARRQGFVSYVPQAEDVDWDFPVSVEDVVLMGRYRHMGATRRPSEHDRHAVGAALARVGLSDLRRRQIGELSGGQRKRAFVARSIAQDAPLLLLDEPFAGVDRTSEATMVALLKELRDEGKTVLVSTHDLAGIPQLCNEAILLHNRVLAHGEPAEVLTHENLAQAFGQPAVREDS